MCEILNTKKAMHYFQNKVPKVREVANVGIRGVVQDTVR